MLVYKLSKIVTMTDREFYKYCEDVGAKAREWKKRFVALLPEVAKRNLYRKYGFASIVDFAGRLGGVGEYTVESVLRIQKYIHDKPALVDALPKVGVHKLRLIASIATKENQEFLAKKAVEMSKSALEVWARGIRPGTEISKGVMAGKAQDAEQNSLFEQVGVLGNFSNMSSVDERIHYSFDVDKNTDFKLRKMKLEIEKTLKRYATWCEVMQKLIEDSQKPNETIKKIENTSGQASKNFNKPVTRSIPAAIKREIHNKYEGRCGFPGCNKPAEVLHHTKRYAINPTHENIIPLCRNHHEIAHNGLIKNELKSTKKWLMGAYANVIESNTRINQIMERIDQKVRLYSSKHSVTLNTS